MTAVHRAINSQVSSTRGGCELPDTRRADFRPRVVQEAREWLTIVGLVEAGLGVSLVPASFRRLAWGDVQYRPLGPPREFTTIYVCWRPASIPPTAAPLIAIARAAAQ